MSVKGTEAKAEYKEGILEIRFPKVEKTKPVTVKVAA
jgi:HSP20 family molecular chaperone IbpA